VGAVEERLQKLGLVLPEAYKPSPPHAFEASFSWARVHGERVYLAAHGPQNPDGTLAPPFGKVGEDLNVERATQSVKLATLALVGSLKRAVGELDRVTAWLTVNGMVNVAAGTGFTHTTTLFNTSSRLIVELFGPEIGAHARTVIGAQQLPVNLPVMISAEVAFR
jgi:enamine deaminase RidA (YjgF/YER057c/UK114 family)